MRRSDKRIEDQKLMETILKKAMVCRIALIDEDKPYIVPMNYGYKDNCIYLHSASEGRKIDILKRNNSVCFEIEYETELLKAENPCNFGMKYYSIIGWGKAVFIEEYNEKIKALDVVMQKYAPGMISEYDENLLNLLSILRIEIDELTGKSSGY